MLKNTNIYDMKWFNRFGLCHNKWQLCVKIVSKCNISLVVGMNSKLIKNKNKSWLYVKLYGGWSHWIHCKKNYNHGRRQGGAAIKDAESRSPRFSWFSFQIFIISRTEKCRKWSKINKSTTFTNNLIEVRKCVDFCLKFGLPSPQISNIQILRTPMTIILKLTCSYNRQMCKFDKMGAHWIPTWCFVVAVIFFCIRKASHLNYSLYCVFGLVWFNLFHLHFWFCAARNLTAFTLGYAM